MMFRRGFVFTLSALALLFGFGIVEGSIPVVVSAATEVPASTNPEVPAVEAPVAVDPRTGRADAENTSGCLSDPSVLQDLQSQRERLARRERDLAGKEAEIKVREQAVSEQMKKLEEIRAEISKTEEFNKKGSEEKIAKLVEMIQTMSPKAASKVVNELDETLAVAAMDKMDTVKLAKIMNNLEPKKSSRLSELLAGVVRARNVAVSETRPVAEAGSRAPSSTENTATK